MITERARAVALQMRSDAKRINDPYDAASLIQDASVIVELVAHAEQLQAELDNIKQVEFPRRLGNVTKPLIAERDALRAEVERLRSAMLSEQQITRILRCLNTPYQADLRLVLLDLYAAQDAVSTRMEDQE